MKKKIIFPITNRVHGARQKLLLAELKKSFEVVEVEYAPIGRDMAAKADDALSFFSDTLRREKPDLLLARGDRFEILPIVMAAAYMGIPVAHIEGGDQSSVIDGKVRHSISHLADWHFPTNQDAHERLIRMGIPMDRIWNFGSLDAEFALSVEPKGLRGDKYILVAYHPIPGEDPEELEKALRYSTLGHYESPRYDIVRISSNSDYGRKYGSESYSPEDYINLLRFASCAVGNSSSLFKEASVLGTSVVNVGSRQTGRLTTKNILDVPCIAEPIKDAIEYQAVRRYLKLGECLDQTYYQPNTAKNIANKIKEILK